MKKRKGKRFFGLQFHPNEKGFMVIWYLLFGLIWIILSDNILYWLVDDVDQYSSIQTIKGIIYVLITTVIIYMIVRGRIIATRDAADNVMLIQGRLSLIKDDLESQKLLTDKIIHNAPLFIMTLDAEGNLIGINQHALTMFSIPRQPGGTLKRFQEAFFTKNKAVYNEFKEKLLAGEMFSNFESTLVIDDIVKTLIWNNTVIQSARHKVPNHVLFGLDITEKKKAHAELETVAYRDHLTGLLSRAGLEREATALEDQNPKHPYYALVHIDLDNFKYINETLGHHAGDELLKYCAGHIIKAYPDEKVIARLGADEFAVLFVQKVTIDDLLERLESLKQLIGKTWYTYNYMFFLSLSFGVAMAQQEHPKFSALSRQADIALHNAKRSGKDRTILYRPELRTINEKHILMAKELQRAIEEEQFVLFFQPSVDLVSRKIIGFESLIRWVHPEKGFIPPKEFIPLAEETGQIFAIERFVFKEAFKAKQKLEAMGYGELQLSINISAQTLISQVNFSEVLNQIDFDCIDCKTIIIEITETALLQDVHLASARLRDLQNQGMKVALDDFGTGYSSLSYLQAMLIDYIKLAQDFVSLMSPEHKGSTEEIICKYVIGLGKELGFQIIAEGIETEYQLNYLLKHGCTQGQGYFIARPASWEDTIALLKKGLEESVN